LAAHNARIPADQLALLIHEWFELAPLALLRNAMRPGLPALLEGAQAQGMRLGVLSDYPPDRKLTAMGIREAFDVVVAAQDQQVGCFKPEPRGLLSIMEQWGLGALDCVYVGDRADVDVEAARRAGVRCVIIGKGAPGGDYERAAGMHELGDLLSLRGVA
jgi:HAD superfamily hydrolase (TIGR01549 family)